MVVARRWLLSMFRWPGHASFAVVGWTESGRRSAPISLGIVVPKREIVKR